MNISPVQEAMIVAREQIRLLALGYYISGGIGAVMATFMIFYVAMFAAFSFIPEKSWANPSPASAEKAQADNSGAAMPAATPRENHRQSAYDGPPVIIFRIFALGMGALTVAGWLLAGLTVYAGYCLQKRKHRVLISIMGGLNLIWIPYGTLLGVATFLVLGSAAGKLEFEGPPALPQTP